MHPGIGLADLSGCIGGLQGTLSVADLSGCIGGLLGKPWCWLWVMLTVVMDGKSTPWCWYGCWQWLYMWF